MNTHAIHTSKQNQSAALAALFVAAASGFCFLVAPTQARAETTTQTVQIGTGAQAVTVTVTSPAPVVVSATTAQAAQYNAGVPAAQNIAPAGSDGRETSLAFPKARGVNMFFQFGPTWMHLSNPYGSMDWYGVTLSLGWRFNKYNKLQIDSSLLSGSRVQYSSYYDNWGRPFYSKEHVNFITGMDALTYSFVIPFDRKGVVELRLSPSIGFAYVHANFKGQYYVGNAHFINNSTEGRFASMAGGGIGLTFHTSKRFMLDLGYRYMRIQSLDYNWGTIPHPDTSSWTFLVGWKF
jgi:hypothetical protein